MSKKTRLAPNIPPDPVKPDAWADPTRTGGDVLPAPEAQPGDLPPGDGVLFDAPPGVAPQTEQAPGSPPQVWLELTHSAGPPAHWLALFESESLAQTAETIGLEAESEPATTLSGLPEPSLDPDQIRMLAPEDPPRTIQTALEQPSILIAPNAPISQAPEPSDLVPPPRLRLRPAAFPLSASPDQKPDRGERPQAAFSSIATPGAVRPAGVVTPALESPQPARPQPELAEEQPGPVRVPMPTEATAPQLETTLPSASPLPRLRLRPAPAARQPAEPGLEPVSTGKRWPAAASPVAREERSDSPVEPVLEEAKSRNSAAPRLIGSPSQQPVNPPAAILPDVVPALPEQPAASFSALKLIQPPDELQWSEPSSAHWPALPDALPPARPSERRGSPLQTLRPERRLRLNREQKGKSWNA